MFSDPNKVISELFVAEGMTVADFGSGAGFYTLALAKKVGPYGRVFAIDSHPDFLKRIKNEAVRTGLQNVEVIQGDLESKKGSGLVTASVDRIVIANTLFSLENLDEIVSETKRVLKHDGKVVVIDWNESYGQIGPHPDHVVTKDEAREIFEKEGFHLESFIDAGSHHYGMLYVLTHTPTPGELTNVGYNVQEEETSFASKHPGHLE
ncbi:MAG: class I SAM-dependent methyltransferase [Candidatus Pacebacteria bacterium]|nr:class I SAM-dependent methyltransferase [Candidatus Paceibacterota bacterium]